jgi:hypothetical protein
MVSQENQRPPEQSYEKRPPPTVDALQQGPRKKPLVAYYFALICSEFSLTVPLVALQTLSSIMGGTLGEPYMHCATCMH